MVKRSCEFEEEEYSNKQDGDDEIARHDRARHDRDGALYDVTNGRRIRPDLLPAGFDLPRKALRQVL